MRLQCGSRKTDGSGRFHQELPGHLEQLQRPGDRRVFQSIGRRSVGGGVVHTHSCVGVARAVDSDGRLPGILGDCETGSREVYGEDAGESKECLEFHEIELIFTALGKRGDKNGRDHSPTADR